MESQNKESGMAEEYPEWDIIEGGAQELKNRLGDNRKYYVALFDDTFMNRSYTGEDPGGWNKIFFTRVNIPNLKSVGFNDRASSIDNMTDRWVTCYGDADYKGRSFRLRPGKSYSQMRARTKGEKTGPGPDPDYDWNDKITSIKFD
jgi:hypothetical protein